MPAVFKKILAHTVCAFMCSLLLSSFSFIGTAIATNTDTVNQGTTVIPDTSRSVDQCLKMMLVVEAKPSEAKAYFIDKSVGFETGIPGLSFATSDNPKTDDVESDSFVGDPDDILACGIKTGHIKLWMIPYYIKNILEFVIALSGLVAVGGFVYGAYVYMFGGLIDEKEKGKKAIMYSIGGMVLTLIAWAVVNIFISIVSSF